jgi:hypothetical protein
MSTTELTVSTSTSAVPLIPSSEQVKFMFRTILIAFFSSIVAATAAAQSVAVSAAASPTEVLTARGRLLRRVGRR